MLGAEGSQGSLLGCLCAGLHCLTHDRLSASALVVQHCLLVIVKTLAYVTVRECIDPCDNLVKQ